MTQEKQLYYRASRYPTKTAAGEAFTLIDTLLREEGELSAYRLVTPSGREWCVVVIGEQPPPRLHQRLETILTRGEKMTLDAKTLTSLLARRNKQLQRGDHVTLHHHYLDPEE